MKAIYLLFLLAIIISTATARNKIFDGVVIENEEFPAVVKIYTGSFTGVCTGTFISHNTLITAAHCVIKSESPFKAQNFMMALTANGTAVSRKVYFNKKFQYHLTNGFQYDIAIVVFPDNTAPATIPLSKEILSRWYGQKVTMVGFGTYEGGYDGKKRVGTNYARRVMGSIEVRYGLYSSTVGKGDSGGPLLRETSDGEYELVGITSWGLPSLVFESDRDLASFYAIPMLESNLEFLKSTEEYGSVLGI